MEMREHIYGFHSRITLYVWHTLLNLSNSGQINQANTFSSRIGYSTSKTLRCRDNVIAWCTDQYHIRPRPEVYF